MTKTLNQFRKWALPLESNLNENNLKASLIVSLRWLIMIVEFLIALTYGFRNQLSFATYSIVLLSVMSLIIFNTIVTIRINDKKSVSTLSLALQLLFDLSQLYIFLKIILPEANPLVEIFYLPLIVAIITLPILWNFGLTLVIGLCVASFYFSAHADHHNYHHFYSHLFTMALLWVTLNLLMSLIRDFQKRFDSIQNYKKKMDHLKVVGAMTSGFCHQMATPLNTIKLRLDRVKRNQNFSQDDLNSSLMALGQCEKALKDLSHLRIDKNSDLYEKIELRSFCEELINNSYPELLLELDDRVSDFYSHPQLLTQTLLDLFDNAFDSSSLEKNILKIYKDEEFINFEVINKKSNLPESVIDKLGEPFNSTKELGSGLGLFNAFNSALVMKGKFKIFNQSNNVHAILSLPIKRPEGIL